MSLPLFTTAFAPPEQLQCRASAKGIGLRTRTEALRHLLKQVVYGEQPPEKVLHCIEALSTATP